MKRIVACLVLVGLLGRFGLPTAHADMISERGPHIPDPPPRFPKETRSSRYPTYAIAAGVVAVALTGSLIALRAIRKRSGS